MMAPAMVQRSNDPDTAQYIQAHLEGDPNAFEALFILYKDRVYSVALHFCRDRAAAEDITQIVFLKLFRKMHVFRAEAEFSTWLYRIVANTCLDQRRKTKIHVPILEIASGMSVSASQEERVFRKQIYENVRKAVAELRPKLRIPLLLRFVAGLSYLEIAEAMQTSEGTIASRIHRAHLQLAEKLRAFKDSLGER